MGIIPLILDHIRARRQAEQMLQLQMREDAQRAQQKEQTKAAREIEPMSPSDFSRLMQPKKRKQKES
jgi:hypothetical protein